MNKILLLAVLTVAPSFAALTVSNISFSAVSHSSAMVTYNWSGGYGVAYRTRYVANPSSSNTCKDGVTGTLIWNSNTADLNPHNPMNVNIGGLQANTPYEVCPEVTDDFNLVAWSSGVGATFTTAPLPAIHPAPPIPPKTFSTAMPDVSAYTTVDVAADCHDFQGDLDTAVNNQVSHGTVIRIPAGTVCQSGAPYSINEASPDVKFFGPNNVDTVNGIITIANGHGFSDGQQIQFGRWYYGLPTTTGCGATIDSVTGQLFYAHVLTSTTFSVYCGASSANGGTKMGFSDTGGAPGGNSTYEVAGWPRQLNWVIVRTKTDDSLLPPAGTRINPSWASKLAVFKMPSSLIGSDGSSNNQLITLGYADSTVHYLVSNIRFVGIEITTDDYAAAHTSSDPLYWHHLFVTNPWSSNIILDRVYGHIPTGNRTHRGMFWDGNQVAIIDSYFDNLVYGKLTYTGLGITAPNGATQFTIGSGQYDENYFQKAILSSNVTVTLAGSGSGRMYAYFDMSNANALTFAVPNGVTVSCSGATCVSTPATSSGDGSCNLTDAWPKTGAGEVTAGIIGCFTISNGTLGGFQGTPQYGQFTSVWNTEGSNFMVGGLGPGPWIFQDNYSDAAGLPWHHDEGGTGNGPTPRTRGDYTYYRNYFHSDFSRMYGSPTSDGLRYAVRQPLEWKAGFRRLIKGNIFDGGWVESNPASASIALTAVIDQGITDSDIVSNTFQHVPGVVSYGVTENGQSNVVEPAVRLRMLNNLAVDINAGSPISPVCSVPGDPQYNASVGPNYWVMNGFHCANGWVLQGPNSSEDVIVSHNTVVGNIGQAPTFASGLDVHTEGVKFTDNVFYVAGGSLGREGFFADTTGQGSSHNHPEDSTCPNLLAKALMDCMWTPSYVFHHNVLIPASGTLSTDVATWYSGLTNYIPSSSDLTQQGWTAFHGWWAPNNDFRFKSSYCSGCGKPASDGKDVGVDMNQLESDQGNVTLVGASGIGSSTATIAFVAPDSQACPVDYSSTDPTLITSYTRVADTGTTRSRAVTLSGLAAQTAYYYRVDCAVQQPAGKFVTSAATQQFASALTAAWANDGGNKVAREDTLATNPETSGSGLMMAGYLDDGSGGSTTVTLANIPAVAGGYDVYVYTDLANSTLDKTATYQISGSGITTTSVTATDAGQANFRGTFVQANNSAGNYVKFAGITGSSFSLTGTPVIPPGGDSWPRAPFNGIELVPTSGGRAISIDFVGTANAMGATDSAGVIPKAHWNAAAGATGSNLALVDETGSSTTATISWTADGTYRLPQTQNLTGTVLNANWDGTTIKVFGARNESVSFNLVLEAAHAAANNVAVKFDTLTGPGGATIHSSAASGNGVFNWVGRPIELFYVRYLPVNGLSHFGYELPGDERLVPVRFRRPWSGQGAGNGAWSDRPDHDKNYPDIMVPYELVNQFNIAQGQSQSIWADIYIPKGTTPGTYTGTVTVTENATTTKTIPVTLTVKNFTLPDKPTAKAMGFFDEHELRNRYISSSYFTPGSPQGQLAYAISDKYFELFHRHRMALIGDNDCGSTNSPCTGTWGRYDGTLFTAANGYDGPGVGVSNGIYALGVYGGYGGFWNSGACSMNSNANTQSSFNTTADAWGSWFQSHVPSSELSTFDAIMYLCDEPSTNAGGLNQVANVETWSSWHAADAGAGSFLKAASTYDVVDSSQQVPDLQIAIEHAGFGDCGSAGVPCNLTSITQSAANTWEAATGKQLWGYAANRPGTGSVDLEDDGVALRQRAWAQYKKGITRWFQWQTEPYSSMDFFNNPETWGGTRSFDPSWGMVDGGTSNNDENLLVYPGTDTIWPGSNYGVNGPFASLRMKEWRRGIEDVDYLALANSINPSAVSTLLTTAVPSVLWDFPNTNPSFWVAPNGWTQPWSDNPDDWENYRSQLATIISSYCTSNPAASACQ